MPSHSLLDLMMYIYMPRHAANRHRGPHTNGVHNAQLAVRPRVLPGERN